MTNDFARTDTLSRDQTRSLLIKHHWYLAERHVFGGNYAAQVVHGFMCLHPRSSAPADAAKRGSWFPPVPGVKAIAKATGMTESNVRRCMQTMESWGLIDLADGYDRARLVSIDEESDFARQLADRLKPKTPKRTVLVSGRTNEVEYTG
jgi:hypothetical protein